MHHQQHTCMAHCESHHALCSSCCCCWCQCAMCPCTAVPLLLLPSSQRASNAASSLLLPYLMLPLPRCAQWLRGCMSSQQAARTTAAMPAAPHSLTVAMSAAANTAAAAFRCSSTGCWRLPPTRPASSERCKNAVLKRCCSSTSAQCWRLPD